MSDDIRKETDMSEPQNELRSESGQGTDLSRRKFAKAGLIAAPVVMSLTSRPVLGDQCSLSGMLSTTYSGPESPLECAGRTPGFWGTHPDHWPDFGAHPGKVLGVEMHNNGQVKKVIWDSAAPGTLFESVFGTGAYSGLTLMNVINLTGNEDPYQLGAHAVAAWFNSQVPSLNYGMTPQIVVQKFQDAISGIYSGDAASIPGSSGSSDPMIQMKEEFEYLNQRGSQDFYPTYDFLQDSSYWLIYDDYAAFMLEQYGIDVTI